MSITKRARLAGKVVVSKTMLECPKCGRRDVSNDIDVECPKCKVKMIVAFCSTGDKD
jgi:ribosomal protein L32